MLLIEPSTGGYQGAGIPKAMTRKWIYVCGPKDGVQKIGITGDPKKRISQIRSHNAEHVEWHFAQECEEQTARQIEEIAKSRLKRFRHHGEWYDITSDFAVETVKKIMRELRQPEVYIGDTTMDFGYDYCIVRENKIIGYVFDCNRWGDRSLWEIKFIDKGTGLDDTKKYPSPDAAKVAVERMLWDRDGR